MPLIKSQLLGKKQTRCFKNTLTNSVIKFLTSDLLINPSYFYLWGQAIKLVYVEVFMEDISNMHYTFLIR